MSLAPQIQSVLRFRLRIFRIFLVFLFSLLILRLIYLQIIRGSHFFDLSENNRIRFAYIPPARGIIKDRFGVVLARTKPTFDLEILPGKESSKPEDVINFLAELFKEDQKILIEKYQILNKGKRAYQNRAIYSNLTRDQLALITASLYRFPDLQITVVPRREYLDPEANAHLVGYLREIRKDQLEQKQFADYLSGDRVGQQGLERTFEKQLQGKRGVKSITVNVSGQKINEHLIKAAEPGKELITSIDLEMQKAADRALGEQIGAVVAINPQNGEILTLVSHPTYDPNIFNYPLTTKQWQNLINNEARPLSNKAISGTYPPGSVFKIFMSFAGLTEHVLDPEHTTNCPGYFLLDGRTRFNCHKRSGHGVVNLESALAMSCNVFYYQLGQKLGIDKIHDYAKSLGLGQISGINIHGEVAGLVPSTLWKKTAFRRAEDQVWYPGETPSVAIGQGAISVTPIQIARAVATLFNGGKVLKPTVIKDDSITQREEGEIIVAPEVVEAIRQGMWSVVNSERGTGKRASIEKETGIIVAGKTATSQTVSSKNLQGKESENHAMFVGMAPYDQPEIVVFVLVENGGHGGVAAAPIAKEVLLAYFRDQIKPEIDAP